MAEEKEKFITELQAEEVADNDQPAPEGAVEVKVWSIEEVKTNEIKKFDIPRTAIKALKKKYGKLTIVGIEDKEGYKKVKEAWQFVRNKRLAIDKKHKEIKADYLEISRAIDTERNELNGLIEPLEDQLKAELTRIDNLKEAEKKREETERQQRLQGRVTELLASGMAFDGSYYSIGDISMDVVTLSTMPDDSYSALLGRVKNVNADNLAAAELERVRKEKEQEQLEADKKILQEEQDRLKKEKEQLEQQKKELADQKIKVRGSRLEALGMTFSYTAQAWYFVMCEIGEVSATKELIELMTDQLFEERFSEIELAISAMKKQEKEQEATRLRNRQRWIELQEIGFSESDGALSLRSCHTSEGQSIYLETISTADPDKWEEIINDAKKFANHLKDQEKEHKLLQERTKARRAQVLSLGLVGEIGGFSRTSSFPGIPKMLIDDTDIIDKDSIEWGIFFAALEEQHSVILKLEEEAKILADQKAEADRISSLNDYQRLDEYFDKVNAVPIPEFKNPDYIKQAQHIKQALLKMGEFLLIMQP